MADGFKIPKAYLDNRNFDDADSYVHCTGRAYYLYLEVFECNAGRLGHGPKDGSALSAFAALFFGADVYYLTHRAHRWH